MKKLKKLSLENEMKKEAEQIEKKVREDRSLDDIKVSDEMEKELFNKIQDYEYDKRHKKVVRKKKKSKLVIGALAAVLILVCGSVMTSVGSKSYWKVLWERDNGDENYNLINVEDMETKESEDIDEIEIYKEIAKVMGDYLVRMEYKPKDMVLKRYIIDKEQSVEELQPKIELDDNLSAPISAGEVVGKITYTIDNKNYSTNLVADTTVIKSGTWDILFKICVIILVLVILFMLLKPAKKSKKKRKKGGKSNYIGYKHLKI